MPGFKVKVLADSISPDGVRLVSIAYQAPRPVLAEINTHRALSRNAESSRAIPFDKKLAQVLANPYFPDDLPDGELLGESKGMQASAHIPGTEKRRGQSAYKRAAEAAVRYAKDMADSGFHKQDVNRLLEPFAYTRGVVSATDLANFFALRCDWRAYPPFRFLARCLYVALSRSTPDAVEWDAWHLPFIKAVDRAEAVERGLKLFNERGPQPDGFTNWAECLLARWSAARCARVSYYQFGRKTNDWDKDSETYDKLAGEVPMHASPLEHPARCDRKLAQKGAEYVGNFRGPWLQLRKLVPGENILDYAPSAETVAGWNVPEDVFTGDPGSDW